MPISRRLMLQLAAMVPVPGLAMAQGAVSLDAALSERSIGSKDGGGGVLFAHLPALRRVLP